MELDLVGTWEFQKVSQLNYPPPDQWQTTTVPGFLSGWQYEHAWFRRTFAVPSAMAGTPLKLCFGGVKFNAQIWVNGIYLGGYLNGYEPFEFNVTSAVRAGQTNELVVGITDWTATFIAPVDFSTLKPFENPRDHATNTLLAPIGGRYDQYGIWQPVKLVSLPAVSIADVFVMPSVRTQQLTVRLTLRNDTASPQTVSVHNRVLEGSNTVLVLPDQQVTIAPGTAQCDIRAPWPNPHWWSPSDPYLYFVETVADSGPGQDQVQTRFGFREFWTDGGCLYLNGLRINLLAAATWPPANPPSTDQIRRTLLEVKAGNNVALRLHTQPWDESWYDIADEVGLLMVEECAVWCDSFSYRLSDPVFWTNYSRHLTAAVKRDRNHPAIVLWSLENEILHCGGAKACATTDVQLAAMGRLVKALDPTRPITYEADLDPGGQADVLGLHYPHEYPDYQVWPNAAYWLDQSIARDWVAGGKWKWDRAKPLYIGEFLWVPSTSAADFTILFGDAAYTDPNRYRNLAKELTWRMQIEAYRAYGVNGICPWTLFEDPAVSGGQFDLHPDQNRLYQAQKAAYYPQAAFIEEYNARFFAGETVQRTLHVYNDRMTPGDFNLRWRAGTGPEQTRSYALPPAGQQPDRISFAAPAAPGSFALELVLSDANQVVYTNTIGYRSMPRTTLLLPSRTKVGLYDPSGVTTKLFERFGLSFSRVTNLRTAPYHQFNLLVVGGNALTNEPMAEIGPDSLSARWQDFARQGGWVLVLEQTNYPAWMPADLRLEDFDASFAFPNPDHPITQDLTDDDLRWWADDHRLVIKALAAPARGNFRVLASIGSRRGLDYAAAVELPIGTGGILCSQWLLTQRFDLEPLAGILLQRILNYCRSDSGRLPLRPAALAAETHSPAGARLSQLGLLAENFLGRLPDCDPELYPVLVVSGDDATWQEAARQLSNLTRYVEHGGKLVLHRPASTFLTAAQPVLFPELEVTDARLGLVLRRESTNAVVRLSNHDLYWIDQPGDWNRPELLSTNVASRYYRQRFNLSAYDAISVAQMPIHTTGGASSGGWWLWGNGYVAQDITVTQPGTHLFNILARGTPVLGGWPQMSLMIDGRVEDTVTVPANQPAFYTLSADLTAGPHQLAVSFDNDAYSPPEDRNLFLDQIRWGRLADNDPATLLTRPGTVAQVCRGNGLIILDEIAWESESANAVKAGRLASALLTGLGASMSLPPALRLEAETMRNVNTAAYSVAGGVVWLSSNGRLETPVRFTTTGSYTFEVVAGGTAAKGVLPQISVVIDGVNRTNFFLASTAMTRYRVALSVTAGTHAVGLAFLNDFYAPPEDRNAAFDNLTIQPETPPRITRFLLDPAQQSALIQWESVPGQSYEVQAATNLESPDWRSVQLLAGQGNVTSWADTSQTVRAPQTAATARRQFYRVVQVGP